MVEESSPLVPPTEKSIEAETDAAPEPEPESGEFTSEPAGEPGFVCDTGEWMRSACKGLPFYKEHESQRYCVLHYPCKEKSADFKAALETKLNSKDFDFRGVCFPDEVDFTGFEFSEDVDFSSATFNAVAHFSFATFSAGAGFSEATFSANAYFSGAKFGENANYSGAMFTTYASFSFATFCADAGFREATFSADASFRRAKFSADVAFELTVFHARADFGGAYFHDSLRFLGSVKERLLADGASLAAMALGKDPSLDFQHVRIENPEQISFGKLNLRPHWFINVDSRKFDFTEVEWVGLLERRYTVADEINKAKEVAPSPHKLLSKACWQLASNAEENHRFREASHLRYWSMDTQRREMSMKDAFYWLHWIYWGLSGYGERILRAFIGLIVILGLFTFLYKQVGFSQQSPATASETATSTVSEDRVGKPLELVRAFTYSLGVMSLQKPEPRPVTSAAQTLVILETIFGPVQAALLALAIRRRFMVSS